MPMRTVSVRDIRAMLPSLEEVVAREGEVVVTRRGKAIARVLPVAPVRKMPTLATLRSSMPHLERSSTELIRADREGRG